MSGSNVIEGIWCGL